MVLHHGVTGQKDEVAVVLLCSYVNNLPCIRLCALETRSIEMTWLLYRQLLMPHAVSHVAIRAIYYPPSADNRAVMSHILDSLDTIMRDHPYAGLSWSESSTSCEMLCCYHTH